MGFHSTLLVLRYISLNSDQFPIQAFEWVVRDVHRLRDHVERSDRADASSANTFDVLTEEPTLADGKFKLEIGDCPVSMLYNVDTYHSEAKPPPLETTETESPAIGAHLPTLSLYVTSVMLEFAHADYEISASMFAGIKCQDDRAGERGARPDWAWEFWQNDWVFREDSEVWGECKSYP